MMKLKTLLIAVMSLIATTMSAQETATKTAYAVYCAGSEAENDPATLYFLAADAEPTGTHNGQTIGNVWSGTAVTATGRYNPAWINLTGLKTNLKRVVFEESFKDVKPTSCYYWFSYCKNLATIEGIANLNTESVTDMRGMFSGCSALTSLDLSSFKTGSVTDMANMFYGCVELTSLNLSSFTTESVENMANMFYNCKALESLTLGSGFTAAKVKNMNHMFYYCSALTSLNLSSFTTNSAEYMQNMFYNCTALESLTLGSGFTTASVKDMTYMFYGCSALPSLNLSSFTTNSVEDMSKMFAGCSALTSLDLSSFTTGSVKSMNQMFFYCINLTSLDLRNFTTGSVTDMSYMFYECNALNSLDLRKADKAVNMVKTGTLAKRGMAIYLPADADVSDAVFEENFVIKPDANSTSFARTFTSGNMSTLCLPFAVNTADVTAGTFYEFKGRSDDGSTVKFGKPASGSTTADKAYIFKPSTGDKVTFTGVAIERLPELTEGDAEGLYGVYTKKEFTPDEADKNIYYGWASGKFVSIGAGATLNPGRAYLKLSQTSGAKNIVNAVFDDEMTGISEVNTTADDNTPAYDLMGRRVGAGYKGIVIKNGRKIRNYEF